MKQLQNVVAVVLSLWVCVSGGWPEIEMLITRDCD